MKKESKLMYGSTNSKDYLDVQGGNLDRKLQSIDLSEEDKKKIIGENTKKHVIDKSLGFLGPFGGVISAVLDWNEDINNELTEAKKAYLLEQYFIKTEMLDDSLNQLREFLINSHGNTLFNKILSLLDDSPPDRELSDHLSVVLKNIVIKGNFEKLFEKHRYALGQIERLTPQTLTIIADYRTWPPIQLERSATWRGKVTTDFHAEFAQAYCSQKGIVDEAKLTRIQHAVIGLQNTGLMEAFKTEEGLTLCKLTFVGEDLLWYISI